jgi:hypothetical protein
VEEGEELDLAGSALRSYLRVELDNIDVRPLPAYLGGRARKTRFAGVARWSLGVGGATVVLVAALVVGAQLRTLREPASATATSSVAPSSIPTPPLRLSPSLGLLALTRDGFVVRGETDASPIRRIEPTSQSYDRTIAVSRSGRFVAYWRPALQGEPSGDVLMVYDAATNADPRPVVSMANEVGGPLVWADDDSGIAFTSQFVRSPPGVGKRLAVVEMQGAAARGPVREIGRSLDARTVLIPLAWIRETRSVSAIEGDPAGVASSYVRAPEDGSGPLERVAVSSGDQVVRLTDVVANQQSRMLAYLVTFRCQDGSPGCTLIRFWALEDPRIAVGWQAVPGSTFVGVQWRPFSRDLLVLTRDDPVRVSGGAPVTRLEAWNSAGHGATRTLAPLPPNASELVPRPDGRAIFAAVLSGGWPATLYDFVGTDTLTTDLATSGGGNPHYAVTLETKEADRIEALPRASPLLTDAEVLAFVAKAADRIDASKATLDSGTYPFAGRAPVWTVKATGSFSSGQRGLVAGPPPRCEFVKFNARTGQLIGIQFFPNENDCA